ncbi:MAG: hypothetical protein ACO3N0_13785 [bacterium]
MKSLRERPFNLARRIIPLILLCYLLFTKTVEAQETGPLLMKQQLGYTLAGGVTGVGIGALLWFMDPLNPNVKPIDQAKDGFVYGSAFGALFGFYLLNNSVKFPARTAPVQNFDDLLGMENRESYRNRPDKAVFGWRLPIYEFRF